MAKKKETSVEIGLCTDIVESSVNGFYYVEEFANGTADVNHWCNGNRYPVATGLKSDKEIKEAISKHEKSL